MQAATIAEVIIAVLVGVGIIVWLVRRNFKDEQNTNPNLTNAVKNQTPDQVHQEDFKKEEEPPQNKE